MDFKNKKYSEEEIRKVINQLLEDDWYEISEYQILSENFIREFKDKVDWFNVSSNEKLQVSDKFCEDFDHKLGFYNCWRIS
jgi:hypothetical protein